MFVLWIELRDSVINLLKYDGPRIAIYKLNHKWYNKNMDQLFGTKTRRFNTINTKSHHH
jgi:hypothetical protein